MRRADVLEEKYYLPTAVLAVEEERGVRRTVCDEASSR